MVDCMLIIEQTAKLSTFPATIPNSTYILHQSSVPDEPAFNMAESGFSVHLTGTKNPNLHQTAEDKQGFGANQQQESDGEDSELDELVDKDDIEEMLAGIIYTLQNITCIANWS